MPEVIVHNPRSVSPSEPSLVVLVELQDCVSGAQLKTAIEKFRWVLHAIPSSDRHGWAVTLRPDAKWSDRLGVMLKAVVERNVLASSES